MNGFDLSTISGLYVGSTEYTSIYKGSTVIWQKSGPTPIDYSREYFTIESLEDNNVIYFYANDSSLLRTIQVSTDKTNWISYTSSTSGTYLRLLNTGVKLYIRGSNDYYATSTVYNYFSSTKKFNVSGNIMSLIYSDNFVNQTALPGTYTFYSLFKNCTKLVDIYNLILPATGLTNYCYSNMFYGCSSLTTAPSILPATTLKTDCYRSMFDRCSSLTTAPELPATTLAQNCYRSMFYNCTSLTTAPELPATSLLSSCYQYMFYGCTLIHYIKALFTTDISSTTAYTNNWLYKVAVRGIFVKSKDATWSRTDASGIPSGWTVTTI